MIELIFAIIVIAIAMLAIPGVFEQVSSQTQEVLKTEAVYQANRTLQTITTYAWDENSPSTETNISYILDTTNGDSDLARISGTRFRKGNFGQKVTRRFHENTIYATSSLGIEGATYDDIDDFNGKKEVITKQAGDIVIDMNLSTKVFYIGDSADYQSRKIAFTIPTTSTTGSTNIKMIEINVTGEDGTILLMRAFSSNVGEPRIKYKDL